MSSNDNELINNILDGNEYALEVLINRYYKTIYAYVYRVTGEYHLTCDLTQEIFIKMIRNIKKYNYTEGKFINWLMKISVNHCRDYFKGSYYKNSLKNEEITEREDLKNNTNVILFLENKEEREEVIKALKNLSEEQREIIILKYYEDMKIKDISIITGSNESTVKTRLYSGLRKLKKILIGGEDSATQRKKYTK